jgi:hypothetical protein
MFSLKRRRTLKLRVDGLVLEDEFARNIAVDVEKHDEHGLR